MSCNVRSYALFSALLGCTILAFLLAGSTAAAATPHNNTSGYNSTIHQFDGAIINGTEHTWNTTGVYYDAPSEPVTNFYTWHELKKNFDNVANVTLTYHCDVSVVIELNATCNNQTASEITNAVGGAASGGIVDTASTFTDPVVRIVTDVVRDKVLKPVVGAILTFTREITDSMLHLFLGSDHAAGTLDDQPGLSDLPRYAVQPFIIAGQQIGPTLLAPIDAINQTIVDTVESAGIAGPPVGAALVLVETIAVLQLGGMALQRLPINFGAIRATVLGPIKALLGAVR